MRAVEIIAKQRDSQELTQEEIDFLIQGYTRGDIPDYQMAAWAMAVVLNGMSAKATAYLTMALAHSGEVLDLSHVVPTAVDKHSTGGIGDKTTLVVEPTVAACGLPVGKISGRGLGFSGGTLDKLESIPGFRTRLTTEEFITQLRQEGLVLAGQSADLAPADGKLYALRDVTATVQSIPLIASSIMSKKIAGGAHAIVLDVKVGVGAFMETLEEARKLSELMVSIASQVGRKAVALLSDMNQPLGCAVGNALEVREAIETLHGGGPADFRRHCLTVAGHMLALGGKAADPQAGQELAQKALDGGESWQRFIRLVRAQGGDVASVEDPDRLPVAKVIEKVESEKGGYLSAVNARIVGETAVSLGAGRAKKEDTIDPAVGIEVHCKVGDRIERGQAVFTIHARNQEELGIARGELLKALAWSDIPVDPLPLFYGVVD